MPRFFLESIPCHLVSFLSALQSNPAAGIPRCSLSDEEMLS